MTSLALHPGIPALRVTTTGEQNVTLCLLRRGGVLLAKLAGGCWSLPSEGAEEAERALATAGDFYDSLDVLAEVLECWASRVRIGGDGAGESAAELRAILPALDRHTTDRLLEAARSEASAIEGLLARMRGWRSSPEDLAASLRLVYPAARERTAPLHEIAEELYLRALREASLDARRQGVERIVREETRRVRRALKALDREEGRAEKAQDLRRLADALLASGSRAVREVGNVWCVDDPWAPGARLRIPANPPGASLHESAQRLYRRARKAERGIVRRKERRELLEGRHHALTRIAQEVPAVETRWDEEVMDKLGAAEHALERLGLAARPEHLPVGSSPRRRKSAGEQVARVFHSPGGFTVLVGRSARQNDRLTFKVARPEDYWFHVVGRSGSHVVLRSGSQRELPEEDLLYAAQLAAAYSRTPEGEKVEVQLTRCKHLRKPHGAAPGAVSVRKGRVLLVITPSRRID